VAIRPKQTQRLLVWQSTTVALLVAGYAGYYLCRSNFSVTLPLISQELIAGGMDAGPARVRLGMIASISVLAYALAMFQSGGLAVFLGACRIFLIGMGGCVVFTFAFALGGGSFPVMTAAWVSNRAIQAMGWAGVVKTASRWFSRSTYGTPAWRRLRTA